MFVPGPHEQVSKAMTLRTPADQCGYATSPYGIGMMGSSGSSMNTRIGSPGHRFGRMRKYLDSSRKKVERLFLYGILRLVLPVHPIFDKSVAENPVALL